MCVHMSEHVCVCVCIVLLSPSVDRASPFPAVITAFHGQTKPDCENGRGQGGVSDTQVSSTTVHSACSGEGGLLGFH